MSDADSMIVSSNVGTDLETASVGGKKVAAGNVVVGSVVVLILVVFVTVSV